VRVRYEEDRADALAALAPHLAGARLERALDATLKMAEYQERVLPPWRRD